MRDVPKLVWVLAVGRFVTSASSMLMLFLTLYLTGPRGLAVTTAGLVAGSYGVGMLAGNLTGGRWGDRFGHRRVLVSGSTVVGLGVASIPWLPLSALVVALPVLAYLGAAVGVSNGALSALAVPRGDRRTAVAIGRAASNAGFVVGPPLGALVVVHSYAALFLIDGLVTLAVRIAIGAALPREVSLPAAATEAGHGLWRALRADRALLVLLPAIVAAAAARRRRADRPVHRDHRCGLRADPRARDPARAAPARCRRRRPRRRTRSPRRAVPGALHRRGDQRHDALRPARRRGLLGRPVPAVAAVRRGGRGAALLVLASSRIDRSEPAAVQVAF